MDRREFLEKAALIGAAPFIPGSVLFAGPLSHPVVVADPIRPSAQLDPDAAIIRPLLVELLESFVPELERHGYYTRLDDRYPNMWYMADLKVAWDPVTLETTWSGVHASYVINCGRPHLMVSLRPYQSMDSYFTPGWERDTLEEFALMFRTADRAPLLAQIIEKLKGSGRVQ